MGRNGEGEREEENFNHRKKVIRKHTDLEVYQRAFKAAMIFYEASKKFPVEERYSLTD